LRGKKKKRRLAGAVARILTKKTKTANITKQNRDFVTGEGSKAFADGVFKPGRKKKGTVEQHSNWGEKKEISGLKGRGVCLSPMLIEQRRKSRRSKSKGRHPQM